MVPFKGSFWGVQYDHSYPPSRYFSNAPVCENFVDFINNELILRLTTGVISHIGKVGKVEPPHIILPITIEPTKLRLCLNLMHLKWFMKDTSFSLDSLPDIPNLIKADSFITKLDD